eukprot:423327-Prymnesium_polylepis.3
MRSTTRERRTRRASSRSRWRRARPRGAASIDAEVRPRLMPSTTSLRGRMMELGHSPPQRERGRASAALAVECANTSA